MHEHDVFVKERECIAHRPACGANALGFDFCGLQLVEAAFGQREAMSAQSVEKVVQAVAGGDLGCFEDEVFVGLAFGQG